MTTRSDGRSAFTDPSEFYQRLGVERVVNAADTYTQLGGARLPDEVATAMEQAGAHQVDITRLLNAAGSRIAELTNNPAALVVGGAAAGVAIAVAAAVSQKRDGTALRLSETCDHADEVVVLCCQRNPYDVAALQAGAQLREVGFSDSTPADALRAAFNDRTAAVLWFAGTQFERYSPSLEEMAALASEHGVPLIVDAAAQLPPVTNLWTYRERGADLVIFSGGKGLKGPQASGLIVGTEDWVAACARNSYPHHSVGRTMKTSKENIAGLLAAVERAVSLDWDAQYREWLSGLESSESKIREVASVTTWIDPQGRLGQTCPRLFIEWNRDDYDFTAADLAQSLEVRSPSVHIGTGEGGPRTAYLNPYSLLFGERELVTELLVGEFERGTRHED